MARFLRLWLVKVGTWPSDIVVFLGFSVETNLNIMGAGKGGSPKYALIKFLLSPYLRAYLGSLPHQLVVASPVRILPSGPRVPPTLLGTF